MRIVRRTPSTAGARHVRVLALAALLALPACSGGGPTVPDPPSTPSTPSTPSPPSGPAPGATVPAPVIGSWKAGTVSLLSFWNSHTGDFIGTTGGLAIFFTFEPNDGYSMLLYVLQRPLAWCNVQAWTELKGTARFENGTFVVTPTSGRYKGSNNCAESGNFDRAATPDELQAERKTYWWSFEIDARDGKTYLRLGPDAEDRSWFSRID